MGKGFILFLLSLSLFVSFSYASQLNNPYTYNLFQFQTNNTSGSGNLTKFIELTDTPSSYTGSAGKCVLVNPTESGLNFTTCPSGGGGGAVDSVTSLSSYIIITPTTGDVEVTFNETLLEETINLSIDNRVTQNFLENILDSVYYSIDNPFNFTNKTLLSEFANDVGFITWATADNGTLFRTDQYNASGLIRDWNSTGYIIDWNSTGYIIDWNSTGLIINWSDSFVDTNLNLLNGSNISISESGLDRTININTTGLEEWLNNLYQPLGNVTNTSYITLEEYFNNASQTFILIDEESNLNVNSSIYWANLSAYNTTQFEKQNLNILGINNTWLTEFINSFGFLTAITNIFDQSLNTTDNVTFNNITVTQNISASYFIGDGSQLTNLPPGVDSVISLNDYIDIFPTTGDVNVTFNETYMLEILDTYYYSINNPYDYFNLTNFPYTNNLNFTNGANYWNDTYATFNKSYADILYLTLSQNNWYNDTDMWVYWNGSNILFNSSKLSTIYYNASSFLNISGTTSGTINSTKHSRGDFDLVTFNLTETTGSPGLDMRINFTDILDFNEIIIRYYTTTLQGSEPTIQIFNYNSDSWESYGGLVSRSSFITIERSVFDSTNYISGGVVQMRLYKSSNGNVNNIYYIDWFALAKGFGVPAGDEVDPLAIHKDGSSIVTANISFGEYNITARNVFATNVCYSDGTNCTSTGGGGGNPFDQSLNTTDSPTFNNLTVNNITINRQEFSGNSSWGSCFNGTSIIIGYIEGVC